MYKTLLFSLFKSPTERQLKLNLTQIEEIKQLVLFIQPSAMDDIFIKLNDSTPTALNTA